MINIQATFSVEIRRSIFPRFIFISDVFIPQQHLAYYCVATYFCGWPLISHRFISLSQQNRPMQNGRYAQNQSDETDQGFQRPPPQTELYLEQTKSLNSHFNCFDSIVLSVPKKISKYLSNQKPATKLLALDHFRKNQNGSYNYIKSSSLKKKIQGLEVQQEISQDQYSEPKNIKANRIRLSLKRDKSLTLFEEIMESVLFKTKRTEIGDSLLIKVDTKTHTQKIKDSLAQNPNYTLVYKERLSTNTHHFYNKLIKLDDPYFLNSKFNAILKHKLEKTRLKIQEQLKLKNPVDFSGDFESGNLDHTIRIADNQYNIYLRIDTNTQGHQGWFYFKVTNNLNKQHNIKLNVCHIKKKFRMMQWGQKVYIRQVHQQQQWQQLQSQIQVVASGLRRYTLSFQTLLLPQKSYLISLIPPYTYSALLKDIEIYQQSPFVKVDLLTHSLTGLAIPLLTITRDAKFKKASLSQFKKKLFLMSGRIHPSQTCSSYIINGLIRQLISQKDYLDDFLKTTVIKIVPMLNPDGVVFGNFRTNYLGDDMNRSFNHSDDLVFPQIVALKQLGRVCKQQFGDNFAGFLDMHGHSSQPNSFVYGPEYQESSDNFVECRIFPRIFDQVSRYFKYEMCNFRLQQYKNNTARGYFFKKLKVPSYTIETSYALFNPKGQTARDTLQQMSINQWSQLGSELSSSLYRYSTYLTIAKENKTNQTIVKKPKDHKKTIQHKNIVGREDSIRSSVRNQNEFILQSFQQLKKQIMKEVGTPSSKHQKGDEDSESDGESADQDMPQKDKQVLVKKVREAVHPAGFLFPRVLKPAIVLPSVVPSIVVLGKRQTKQISTMPRLANKFKNKKINRPLNINHEYTEYLLKNISGINNLRPQVINYQNVIKPKVVDISIEEPKPQN